MLVLRRKKFTQTKILNTNAPGIGFTRGRKYDTDMDRLGRMDTAQRELQRVEILVEKCENYRRNYIGAK